MITKNNSKRIKINYFLMGTIIAVSIIFLSYFYRLYKYGLTFENKVYPNVFIDHQDFSGFTKSQVIEYFSKASKTFQDRRFTVFYKDQPVSTFSAVGINLKYDGETAAEQAYLIGRSSHRLSRFYQVFSSLTKIHKYQLLSNINYNHEPIEEFITKSEESYNKPARNALFKFENGKVTSFRNEVTGLKILSDKFLSDFDENIKDLKNGKYSKSIKLEYEVIHPEITLAQSNSFGIEEEIAVGKSDYTHSIPERVHNVILAASKFNGVLIPKDKIFSFVEAIGDISSLTGYKPAYIIKDGKTVLGDGGGVCQVSTTLFRAALNAGLPIVERHPHAYRVGYYENDSKPGFDATIFAPSVDLKIKNDTPGYILIQTEMDQENNLLSFHFYGKKDNRKIEITDIALWDVSSPPAPRYQDDPTLKKGITKQVDFPAWGSKASFVYKVYKNDQLAINEKYYSFYKPWQAVFLVGTAD